jgi:hypothetical protein
MYPFLRDCCQHFRKCTLFKTTFEKKHPLFAIFGRIPYRNRYSKTDPYTRFCLRTCVPTSIASDPRASSELVGYNTACIAKQASAALTIYHNWTLRALHISSHSGALTCDAVNGTTWDINNKPSKLLVLIMSMHLRSIICVDEKAGHEMPWSSLKIYIYVYVYVYLYIYLYIYL